MPDQKLEKKFIWDKLPFWVRDWTNTIVVAFVLAIVIRSFLLQVFWIPSPSMVPTLNINDRIIVNKLAYGIQNPLFESFMEKTFFYFIPNPLYKKHVMFSDLQYFIDFKRGPGRFDVIVFRTYDKKDNRRDLIKRVIGLPGETLELKKGLVYINNKLLIEHHAMINDYLDINSMPAAFGPVAIPQDSYFMMGDNRPNSYDSRYWGFVPKSRVVGPALLKIWPIWNLSLL